MENLLSVLSDHDKNAFSAYAFQYNGYTECAEMASVEHLLRFWSKEKMNMYKMLGNQLILRKPIAVTRCQDQLYSDMARCIDDNYEFVDALRRRLYEYFKTVNPSFNSWTWDWGDKTEDAMRHRFLNSIIDCFQAGTWCDGGTFSNSETIWAVIKGEKIQLQAGQKIMRTLGKLAKLLDLEKEFEDFRIAESMVMNQKKLKGYLNLSIHPLDFCTASDNANNWTSCMSWRESGCYRLGTVEMMNSPIVISAYLTSDNSIMKWDDGNTTFEWPSKKWRCWVIVDKNALLVNREFPYHNDELYNEVLRWSIQLATNNLGYEYKEPVPLAEVEHIRFATNYMYNDVSSEHMCADGVHRNPSAGHRTVINFSGVAECMQCGEVIQPGEDADTLLCANCRNMHRCARCGCTLDEDEIYYSDVDGEGYCCSCFEDMFYRCGVCDEQKAFDNGDPLDIGIPINNTIMNEIGEHAIKEDERKYWNSPTQYNWLTIDCICPDCMDYYGVDLVHANQAVIDWTGSDDEGKYKIDKFIIDPRRMTAADFASVATSQTSRRYRQAFIEYFSQYEAAMKEFYGAADDEVTNDD